MSAPATAIARPSSAPSGNSADGHGSGMKTCDQPHSAARPTVPMPRPESSASFSGRSRPTARPTASTISASTMYSGKCGVASPRIGPIEHGQAAADEQEEPDRAERGAAARPHAGEHEADAGGEHDQHRLEDEAELRHAEVELGLERRQTEHQAAGERHAGG